MSPPEALLPSLALGSLLELSSLEAAPEGTYAYQGRLAGIVRRLAACQGATGPILRLQGELFWLHGAKRLGARSVVVPESIADAVRAAFAEHPRRSTRDRVTVHVDFDLWAIRQAASALGYRLHAEGRASVPVPLSQVIAAAILRPVPLEPSEL